MNAWTLIAPVYSGVMTLLLAYVVKEFKRVLVESKAEKEAIGALIRNAMFEIYEEFRDANEVPIRYQEEIDSLYTAYHGLGFNNTGTRIHDEIMAKRSKV